MTDSLRVVVPRYGASVTGGSETAMRRLAVALAARGWNIEVWTTNAADEATWAADAAAGESIEDGVRVRRFPVRARRPPRLFAEGSRLFFRTPARLRWEAPWIAAQGPWSPRLVAALARADGPTLFTPYLFHPTLRGIGAAPHPRILLPAAHDERPLRLRAVAAAVRHADALWFHTPEERDLLVTVHPDAAGRPWAVGTTGVDVPADLDAGAFARSHGIDTPYLLHGGRRIAGKGLDQLLSGFATLRARREDVTLVLTGDGGDGASCDGVRAVGMLPGGERWNAIAGAVAVVVPGALESLSLLALEAWGAGRPCLLNAASAVLRGQSARTGGGLLFASPEEFADGAERLLDDPALAGAMGRAARDHVQREYRWDDVEARLRDLITRAARP